jgi:hypothetical protein
MLLLEIYESYPLWLLEVHSVDVKTLQRSDQLFDQWLTLLWNHQSMQFYYLARSVRVQSNF